MKDLSMSDDLKGEMNNKINNNSNNNIINSNSGKKNGSNSLRIKTNSPKRKEIEINLNLGDEEIIFNPIGKDIDFEI